MTLENLLKNQTNAVYIPEINDAWIDSEGQEQPPMPEQGCIEFGTPQDAVNFHDTWRKHFSLSMIENTIYIKPKATE